MDGKSRSNKRSGLAMISDYKKFADADKPVACLHDFSMEVLDHRGISSWNILKDLNVNLDFFNLFQINSCCSYSLLHITFFDTNPNKICVYDVVQKMNKRLRWINYSLCMKADRDPKLKPLITFCAIYFMTMKN